MADVAFMTSLMPLIVLRVRCNQFNQITCMASVKTTIGKTNKSII